MGLNRKSGFRQTITLAIWASIGMVIFIVGLYLTGFDAVAAIKDARLSDAPEAGLISNLGIGLMSIAGAVALYGAWRRAYAPLALFSLFCLFFALDDGLMLHEQLGSLEVLLIGAHGLFMLTVIALYWRDLKHLPFPLVACLMAFGISAVVDFAWLRLLDLSLSGSEHYEFLFRLGFVAEDLPKFVGIVLLLAFSLGEGSSDQTRLKSGP